ncbi:MAG: biotin transporter BioY [Jaaginema sp. PMC 1079.18]|nr:biotin transporter BioY [Jaaginema sp. PMC 1080.18]MEC4849914.1 biotin transporter BioY [Jaaginema sp. PMC 1079.18]MEC4868850.1 biotin transporter BioY [Jaaginema sp. PMC 1078.18]
MSIKPRPKHRNRRRSRPVTSKPRSATMIPKLSPPIEFLWAIVGLLLTIGGTMVEAHWTNFPWDWAKSGVYPVSLGVTCQIAAVLLVGCLGGKNAAALSQIAYLVLGLTWQPVFDQGGGIAYMVKPTFGYIIGFIPGAWLCGFLAFRHKAKLESLALSCLGGLGLIHFIGVTYLVGLQLFSPLGEGFMALLQGIVRYSILPLPGQFAIVCAISVLSFVLRQILFY